MAFQVPPAKKHAKIDTNFAFKIGAQSFSVPKTKFLSIGDQETIAGGALAETLDTVFGPRGTKVGDAVRELDEDQFEALMDAYNADSDVTPGESGDSSSSSEENTEKPSGTT